MQERAAPHRHPGPTGTGGAIVPSTPTTATNAAAAGAGRAAATGRKQWLHDATSGRVVLASVAPPPAVAPRIASVGRFRPPSPTRQELMQATEGLPPYTWGLEPLADAKAAREAAEMIAPLGAPREPRDAAGAPVATGRRAW